MTFALYFFLFAAENEKFLQYIVQFFVIFFLPFIYFLQFPTFCDSISDKALSA